VTSDLLHVEVDLPGRLVATVTARPGEVVAVVGPNGAGKTTLLESVAGTLPGAAARVRLGECDWTGVAPQQRSVGLVFQEHLLFPHLDARANVAFGPRARGASRRQSRVEAQRWLDSLEVGRLADRRPAALSGGEAQRVAIARALATAPRLLLLDEPFAALDVVAAGGLRDLLARHLRRFTGVTLMVTHDALDVRALADRVLVLEDGAVVQDGAPEMVAEAPATAHAARLLGLNVLSGIATGTDVALATGGALVLATPTTGPVLATFAPSAVTLTADEPVGSARNRWPATVHRAVERDGVVRVHLHAHAGTDADLYADVTRGAAAELRLTQGRAVWASVKATEVTTWGAAAAADR
jgi:molybdate transport system ATP-binding protein